MKRNTLVASNVLLAGSIALSSASWAASPVNTVNDGRIIQGGSYYNTPGNTTRFINSKSGGLWLKSGVTVRGLEANTNGALTQHGGTLHLYAPDNVVRVDGKIDVNALRNNQGAYLGNGGKVFIDSAYLFQNGAIFANGVNGGLVQANVGAMTLGVGAQIQAKGSTGAGGTVAINTTGPVDLRRGSLIETSGKVLGSLDGNLINIEGTLLRIDGALRANGVATGSRGGTIRLVATGQMDMQDLKASLQNATVGCNSTLTSQERTFLLQRTGSLADGSVVIAKDTQHTTPQYVANLSADGVAGNIDPNNDRTQHRSGDGGTILLTAINNVLNQGTISANGANGSQYAPNGGDGGTMNVMSLNGIENLQGRYSTNGGAGHNNATTGGNGGHGGLTAFHYKEMHNTGGIDANGGFGGSAPKPGKGGNGGLVMFSGSGLSSEDVNPTSNGSIDVIGRLGGNGSLILGGKAGTIVSPVPEGLENYHQQGYVNGQQVSYQATQKTQPVELLTHHENLIMLTRGAYRTYVLDNVFQRMLQANTRSVEDPTGALGQARTEVINKNTGSSSYVYRNLVLGSNRRYQSLTLDHPYWDPHQPGGAPEIVLPSPLSKDQAFTTLNTLTILNHGEVATQYLQGAYSDDYSTVSNVWQIGRYSNSLGGSRISVISDGFTNRNLFGTTGVASGGSINIATLGNIHNTNGGTLTTGTSYPSDPPRALHGGSIILKSLYSDVLHTPDSPNYDQVITRADGKLLGGSIRIKAGHDFLYGKGISPGLISAEGDLQGGIIQIKAGRDIPVPTGDFAGLYANGLSPTQGRGGYIDLHANHKNNFPRELTNVTGGLVDGITRITEGN